MEGSIGERPHISVQRRGAGYWLGQIVRLVVSAALVAGIIAGALAFHRYMVSTKVATPSRPTLERARLVDSVVVTPGTIQPRLHLFGQIVAGRTVDLRVLVGGEVKSVSPRLLEGGRVDTGELLVQVDPFEYEGALVKARVELEEAEARVRETEARIKLERDGSRRAAEQLDMAERETGRLETLQNQGASSFAQLDASKSRRSAAKAAAEIRENQIRVLEAQLARETAGIARLKWNVGKAERDLRNTRLVAPFGGVLSNVAAEIGRLLNVSDRMATITDLARLEVRFALTDAQFARLRAEKNGAEAAPTSGLIGRPVDVTWGPENGQLNATGRIARVSSAISAATGGVDVIAVVETGTGIELLRPGAFVSVVTPDIAYEGVVRVPQSAVHPGEKVFLIGADRRLEPVSVMVVGYDGDAALVRGPMATNAQVLTTRLPDAAAGMLVAPRSTPGATK